MPLYCKSIRSDADAIDQRARAGDSVPPVYNRQSGPLVANGRLVLEKG